MFELKNQTLLVIAPHPDDEVLGCGGLIKKIKDAGGKVYVLFLTVGETIEYSKSGKSTAQERITEIESVAKYLRYDDYRIAFKGDEYHLRLDRVAQKDLIFEIENGKKISLNALKPTIVATSPRYDYNQDHRAATEAVISATRPAPNNSKPFQPLILGYESVPTAEWASESQKQNFFIPLSEKQIETKIKAMNLYTSQVREGNHPRSSESIRTFAKFRGLFAGASAAEAYYCYRLLL